MQPKITRHEEKQEICHMVQRKIQGTIKNPDVGLGS